ncbi:MAG: PadR family transcriptional regulator [Anaerolineales bacterium]|jgi:DNA-binding PadR family transcriptional regulator
MTNAELAVLSLIAEEDRHGYEIEQVIEARGMREWTDIGFSSIYYILKRLQQYGWIESKKRTVVGQGGPRKVYSVTTEGKRTFQQQVLKALSTPARDLDNFQLGLASITNVPKPRATDALKTHIRTLESRAAHVRGRREGQAPLPLHVDGMLDLSLAMIETQLEWIERFIQRWEQQNGES